MMLQLVTFDERFLDKSFTWLSDAELRYLTETPEISKEDQIIWYSRLKYKSDYIIKGITADGIRIGVVGLKSINRDTGQGEFFGYIGEKKYWGKGVGKWMMDAVEVLALKEGLNGIFLNVLIDNIRAINLYFQKGYKIYKYTGNSYLMKKNQLLIG